MKELLEAIIKGIVNTPDDVQIEVRESVDFPGLTILEVEVSDADKGIVIGRRGRTINAIRDLMTISAIRNDKKIKVLVKDDRDTRPAIAPRPAVKSVPLTQSPIAIATSEVKPPAESAARPATPTSRGDERPAGTAMADRETEDMLSDDEL